MNNNKADIPVLSSLDKSNSLGVQADIPVLSFSNKSKSFGIQPETAKLGKAKRSSRLSLACLLVLGLTGLLTLEPMIRANSSSPSPSGSSSSTTRLDTVTTRLSQ
jgi:hypothetical protein